MQPGVGVGTGGCLAFVRRQFGLVRILPRKWGARSLIPSVAGGIGISARDRDHADDFTGSLHLRYDDESYDLVSSPTFSLKFSPRFECGLASV